jgi:hydroxymethylbilane synthase
LVVIRTMGDDRLDVDLARPGPLAKGLFTKQLEEALVAGEVDAAVHSLKDLPVDLPEGLVLGAIPEREDPADVLVSRHGGGIGGLPSGARVATSSARREAILRNLRPDLEVVSIRGNVPTRLRKLAEDPALDALVLAMAGLRRLGFPVPPGLCVSEEPALVPAPGQGALGIECREDDANTRALLATIHHSETARCVASERNLLKGLGGGCASPVGALARIEGGRVVLRAVIFSEE